MKKKKYKMEKMMNQMIDEYKKFITSKMNNYANRSIY